MTTPVITAIDGGYQVTFTDNHELSPYATVTFTDIRSVGRGGHDCTIEFSSEVNGVGAITDDIGLANKADHDRFGNRVAGLMDTPGDSKAKQDWPYHIRAAARLVRQTLAAKADADGVGDIDIVDMLVDIRHAVPSPDADDWLIEQLFKRRQVIAFASTEGLGKSQLAREMALRLVLAEGSLLGRYPVPKPESVLLVDMENGPDEELKREDDILAALGKRRDDIPGGRYHRVSFPAISLSTEHGRAKMLEVIRRVKPALTILDTGGMLVGSEYGDEFKTVFNWLKTTAHHENTTILIAVHLVKPDRSGGRRQKGTPRSIQEVMGQWTRWADGVLVMSETDEDEAVRLDIWKRIPNATYILKRDDGLWRAVKAIREVPKVVAQTLRYDIISTISELQPVLKGEVVARLVSEEAGRSRSTLFNKVGQEVGTTNDDLVQEDDRHRLSLTEAGEAWLKDASKAEEKVIELGPEQMEMGVGQEPEGGSESKSQSSPSPELAPAEHPASVQPAERGVQPQSSIPSVESSPSPEPPEVQSSESSAPIYRGGGRSLDSTGLGMPKANGKTPAAGFNGHVPESPARPIEDDELTADDIWQEMGL